MDILVIGGGQRRICGCDFAAKKGANVKLIERDKAGRNLPEQRMYPNKGDTSFC